MMTQVIVDLLIGWRGDDANSTAQPGVGQRRASRALCGLHYFRIPVNLGLSSLLQDKLLVDQFVQCSRGCRPWFIRDTQEWLPAHLLINLRECNAGPVYVSRECRCSPTVARLVASHENQSGCSQSEN